LFYAADAIARELKAKMTFVLLLIGQASLRTDCNTEVKTSSTWSIWQRENVCYKLWQEDKTRQNNTSYRSGDQVVK
jgi:hypothetical protein